MLGLLLQHIWDEIRDVLYQLIKVHRRLPFARVFRVIFFTGHYINDVVKQISAVCQRRFTKLCNKNKKSIFSMPALTVVFAMMIGGWNGYLSLSKISKLYLVVCLSCKALLTALLSISSCELKVSKRLSLDLHQSKRRARCLSCQACIPLASS